MDTFIVGAGLRTQLQMTHVHDAPSINGISFRRFESDSDYSAMSTISTKSWLADGFEWIQTAQDIASSYRDTEDRNPFKDILLIEGGSETVGYGEINIEKRDDRTVILWNSVHLLPEWRGRGIREAVFEFNEKELKARAKAASSRGFFQVWANDAPNDWKSIVLANGFKPSWHVLEMVRRNLDDIPHHHLPEGLEVRPISSGDYRQIWEGMRQAYSEEPWFTESRFDEAHFRQWVDSPDFSSDLWQVAWDSDKVVGTVQNFVKKEENETFGRKRGHTERIFVIPSWQRRGVARALISRSLRMLREMGLKEATLDVTAENVSGALHLYESMGYRAINHFTFYRKPILP